jgi:Spy/CpxP family protein refolding chaperone
MKTAGLSLAALALVALVGPAGAQQGHMQKAGKQIVIRTDRADRTEKLQLTDAQKAQMRELRFAAAHRRVELRAKLEDARLRLHELMSADKLDEAAIRAHAATMGELEGRVARSRIEDRLAMMSVLTPEQRKLAGPMGGMMGGMGERRIMIRHRMLKQGGMGGPSGPGDRMGMLKLHGAGGAMQFCGPGGALEMCGPGGACCMGGDDPMSWFEADLGGAGGEPIDVDVEVEGEPE